MLTTTPLCTRLSILIAALLIAALALPALAVQTARAADDTTVTEVECGILLPGIPPDGQALLTTGTLVVTAAGTATLTCRGQLDPKLVPSKTIILTDVDCALGEGGQVAESHIRVSPSGSVLLVCQNNPGSEPFVPGED
jgi:hypothetical protein